MASLIQGVDEFMNHTRYRNQWLHGDEGSLYVRKGTHIFNSAITPTFDLAAVHITYPDNGVFTKLLGQIEQLITDLPIRVENIQSERFKQFFGKRGYTITGDSECWCAWRFPE